MKRLRQLYQTIALIVLNTLVLLLLLEGLAALWLRYRTWGLAEQQPTVVYQDIRAGIAYYEAQPWGDNYWREFGASFDKRYEPYVIWRRKPYSGETITVNAAGIRETPESDCESGAYRVFTFGGSTMWGTGAPDDMTIPAYLLMGLVERLDQAVCVVNFGESGYVSSQEALLLVRQLQKGNIPDLVIFYDGVNDVIESWENGGAGNHQALEVIKNRYEGRREEVTLQKLLLKTNLAQLIQQKFGQPEVTETLLPDADNLPGDITRVYLDNYRLVGALAESYGFDYLFFWQPIIVVGDKPLTPEEAEYRDQFSSQLSGLYQATYAQIADLQVEHDYLFDITAAFDRRNDQIWIDRLHVTPEGNQLIAEAMLAAIDDVIAFEP